jgi:hypothetical protein
MTTALHALAFRCTTPKVLVQTYRTELTSGYALKASDINMHTLDVPRLKTCIDMNGLAVKALNPYRIKQNRLYFSTRKNVRQSWPGTGLCAHRV